MLQSSLQLLKYLYFLCEHFKVPGIIQTVYISLFMALRTMRIIKIIKLWTSYNIMLLFLSNWPKVSGLSVWVMK